MTTVEPTAEQIIGYGLLPIPDYGKKNRLLQLEMQQVVLQLQQVAPPPVISKRQVNVRKHTADNVI